MIGEHTDYNDGFVLPMAIDRAIWIALRPRSDSQVIIHSLDFIETGQFDCAHPHPQKGSWSNYCQGVAWALKDAGYPLKGWEGVMAGDIPIGAGLSSSAALELATAKAFSIVSGWQWHPATMAKICQRAENEWVGMQCGIMDQLISAAGQAGHALQLDCRSLETKAVPLPHETSILILDTKTRHTHTDSGYNDRREQCERAVQAFGVSHLRDISMEELEAKQSQLDEIVYRRARHVVTENERVLETFISS